MDETQQPSNKAPDIRTYLGAAHYLQDYYAYRKLKDPAFSYQTWSEDLGILSKSYLRFAVTGRRKISQELAAKFCKFFQFDELTQEYFILLVHYSQATDPQQKKIFGKRLTQALKMESSFSEVTPEKDILSDPLNVMVRNVLSCQDISADENLLSAYFQVDLTKMQKTLQILKNAGWIEASTEQEKVTWKTKHDTVRVALTQEDYKNFLSEVNASLSQIFSKYNSNQIQGKRMYQVNLNFIPWTKEIG